MTIAQNSDRAEVSEFTRKPAEPLSGAFRRGQFQILPLNKTDAAQRGLLWADVNGDGRPDLLVAEPESGQLSVYLQQPDGSLAPPKTFPTLAGVSQMAAADWNGDGHPEIFLLSQTERAVGVTAFDQNGRLPFPDAHSAGRQAAGDGRRRAETRREARAGGDRGQGRPALARDAHGGRQNADAKVERQLQIESGHVCDSGREPGRPGGFGGVDSLRKNQGAAAKGARGDFDEVDVDPPGGAIEQPWLAAADVDGDGKTELLLPQNNFVRAVVLEQQTKTQDSTNKPAWVFRVKDQINGASSDSRIVGATAVASGTNAVPSLFLLDAEHKQLTLCERDTNGVWRVTRNVDLPVSDFSGLQSVALGGTNVQSIGFLGQNAVAWMPLAGDVWDFTTLDGYDTPIKDGYLNDVMAGDLTGSGRKDLVFLETAKNNLDLVRFDSNHKLVPGERWQVFETHTFRGVQRGARTARSPRDRRDRRQEKRPDRARA